MGYVQTMLIHRHWHQLQAPDLKTLARKGKAGILHPRRSPLQPKHAQRQTEAAAEPGSDNDLGRRTLDATCNGQVDGDLSSQLEFPARIRIAGRRAGFRSNGARPYPREGSAFIYGYVLSGTIESQVEGEPPKVYKAGASFYEVPGAHHLYSRNPSKTEPASLLAVFVVVTNDKLLTTPDK
jgi:hypothetical protein